METARKTLKYKLRLAGVAVSSLSELQDNFSAELLPLLQSGILVKWLLAHSHFEQAGEVEAIEPHTSQFNKLHHLCRILGMEPDEQVLFYMLEDYAHQSRDEDERDEDAEDDSQGMTLPILKPFGL